ncbi:hypothetical protein CRM22_006737 [Opisthorchis felineus]|uniref:Calponin-homology (CH) domain-containing protein n=1 Tax=Opisthorchis felineus TaxID=147828 RepID=A0A4S2LJT2_OPIFE|nr:hypothetical protein CRM22_006737 [Opisthorchis felineus]
MPKCSSAKMDPSKFVCNALCSKSLLMRMEQERVQKKTFTNWLNTYLSTADAPMKIDDLFIDIRDGVALIRILEILSKEKLHTELRRNMQRVHCLVNIKKALEFLESKKVKLVNINPSDIADGKPAIVLGLIWSIILYFQIEEQEELLMRILGLPPGQARSRGSAKQMLKRWVQDICTGKYDIKINDFGPSWRDGIAFNAMVHNIDSSLVEMDKLGHRTARENLEHAFSQAEAHLGIPRLLDAEDVDVDRPDEKSIMTYVAQFFKAYPEGGKREPTPVPISPALPQNISQLLSRIRQTEEKVNRFSEDDSLPLEKHFSAYQDTLDEINTYEECLGEFQATGEPASSELQIALEAKQGLNGAVDIWRWHIDSLVPGELGNVADWVAKAEQWMKTTSKSWCQAHKGQKLVGMWGKPKESWRPGSADPPNSPPSLDQIEKLIKQGSEHFGLKNHRAIQMRDNISKLLNTPSLTTEGAHALPAELAMQIGRRVSETIAKEPGYTAVLDAARARRNFLDLLYANAIVESPSKISIRSRRRTSVAGFERRLAAWDSVLEGLSEEEDVNMLKEMLVDYENCITIENIPTKLENSIEELNKHNGLLVRLSNVDEKLPPPNSLVIIPEWIKHCEAKWNSEKAKRLEELGTELKRRIDAWGAIDANTDKIERWLTQAERLIAEQKQPPDERTDLERWFAEAEEAFGYLGPNADMNRIAKLKSRLAHVDREADKLKQIEQKRREAAEQLERAKAEEELASHLCAVETWMSQADTVLNPSKEYGFTGDCTRANLDQLKKMLADTMDGQEQAQKRLTQAIRVANESPLSPLDRANQERLNNAENYLVTVFPTIESRLKDLDDLYEATGRIENSLKLLEQSTDHAHTWLSNIPLKIESDHVAMTDEFAEIRGNIASCQNQIVELDHLLHTGRMMTLTTAYGLQAWIHRDRLNPIQERLKEIELTAKQKGEQLEEWTGTLEDVRRELDDGEDEFETLRHAVNRASRRDIARLFRQIQEARLKCENRASSILRTAVAQTEKLLHPTKDPTCQLSANAKAEIERQLAEMKDKFACQSGTLEELKSEVQGLMERIKQADEEVKRATDWLSAQERRFDSLHAGPSSQSASLDETTGAGKDGINRQLELHSQWAEECQNYVNTLELEVRPYSPHILRVDKVDGELMDETFPDTSELSTRFQNLLSDAVLYAENAKGLLSTLTSARSLLESSRIWLRGARNAHADFVTMMGETAQTYGDVDGQKVFLSDLLVTLAAGDDKVKEIKQSIQQLASSTAHSNTAAAVMVARRELSDFQTELAKFQRLVESQLKESEIKIACNSQLMADLQAENDWLNELENNLPGSPPPAMPNNGELTLTHLAAEGKKWEQFVQLVKEIKDSTDYLSGKMNKLDLERTDAARMRNVTSVDGDVSPVALMQNLKAKLEELLSRRSEFDEIHAAAIARCEKLRCLPSEVTSVERGLKELFQTIRSDLIHLQSQVDMVEQFVFKIRRLDQLLDDVVHAAAGPSQPSVAWNKLNDAVSFYTKELQVLQDTAGTLDPNMQPAKTASVWNSSEFGHLGHEVIAAIDHLKDAPELIRDTLRAMLVNWQSKVNEVKSTVVSRATATEKLVRALEIMLACETEYLAFFEPLDEELSDLKRLTSVNSLDSSIKSMKNLLNRLKSDGAVLRTSLTDAVEKVTSTAADVIGRNQVTYEKQICSLLDKVVSNFDKRFDDLQSRLIQLLEERTNLAQSEKGFQTEMEVIMKELNSLHSEANQMLAAVEGSVDVTGFKNGDSRLKSLTRRLEKASLDVANLSNKLNQASTLSPEMSVQLQQLEEKLALISNIVKKCRQLHGEKEATFAAYGLALERYNRAYHQVEQRIAHVLGSADERMGDLQSPLLRPRLSQQLKDLQKLIEELLLVQTILKTKRSSVGLSSSSSSLCTAAIELVECANELRPVYEQTVWLKLERDLEEQLSRLMMSKDQVNSMKQRLTEWDSRMKSLETDLHHIEREIRSLPHAECTESVGAADHKRDMQQTLEKVQVIQHNFLPAVKARLDSLQNIGGELLQTDSNFLITFSEDGQSATNRLRRAADNYENISRLVDGLNHRFQKIQQDEERLQLALKSVEEWSNRFNGYLSDLEEGLLTAEPQDTVTNLWATASGNQQCRNRLSQLEVELKQGECMLRELAGSSSIPAPGTSKMKYDEVYNCIHNTYPARMQKIASELNKLKRDLEAYNFQVRDAERVIRVFVRRAESLLHTAHENEAGILATSTQDERPWTVLMEDLNSFFSSDLKQMENLEERLGLRSEDRHTQTLKKQVEDIQTDLTGRYELLKKYNFLLQKLRNMLTEFEQSVNKAYAEQNKILRSLLCQPLNFLEPSKLCTHLAASTEATAKRLSEFENSTLKRLHQSWQQIMDQATTTNCTHRILELPVCSRLTNLDEDTQDILEELNATLNSIQSLKLGWMDSETRVGQIKQNIKEKPFSLRYESSFSWKRTAAHGQIQNIPTENELEQESQNNMKNLTRLLSSSQQQVKELKDVVSSLQSEKTTVENLEQQLDMVMRRLASLSTHVEKHEERGRRGSPFLMDSTIKPTGAVETFRVELHVLSEKWSTLVSKIQTWINNFGLLIQAVSELDSWQMEFYRSLVTLATTVSSTETKPTSTDNSHTKFILETGKAHGQSIRDWCKQLTESGIDDATNSCVRDQVTRADHVMRSAVGHYNNLLCRSEQTCAARSEVLAEIGEFERLLENLRGKYDQINSEVKHSLETSASLTSLNKMEKEIQRLMLPLDSVNSEVEQKIAYLTEQSPRWLELGLLGKSRVTVLEQKTSALGKLVNGLINHLNQLKTQTVETNCQLKKANQWIVEMAEVIPRAREGHSPVRIPTFGRPTDRTKCIRGRTPTPTQNAAQTLSFSPGLLGQQTPESLESMIPVVCKDRLDIMDHLQKEITKTGPKIIEDVAAMAEQLQANLMALGVTKVQVSEEVEPFRDRIEQLIESVESEKQQLVSILCLAEDFQQTAQKWQKWYKQFCQSLTEAIQRSTDGLHHIQGVSDPTQPTEPISLDIVLPVNEVIQRFRTLFNEVITWRKVLAKLDSQSTALRNQYQDSSAQRFTSEAFGQHEALQTQLHELASHLEQNQPKLMELSDRADRVCLAASNSALGMHALLSNTLVNASEDSTQRLFDPAHQGTQQFAQNTAGGRAKRELRAIREQWTSLNQRISQLIDQSNRNMVQRELNKEWLTRNQTWLNEFERKVELLERWSIESKPQTISQTPGGTPMPDVEWNAYVDQYTEILGKLQEKSPEITSFSGSILELPAAEQKPFVELHERFENFCRSVQQRIDWLLRVRQKIQRFRQVVQETERWLTNTNFKLTSCTQSFGSPDDINSWEKAENSPFWIPKSIESVDQLLHDIEVNGNQLIQRVHQIAHFIVHCALNVFKHTDCEMTNCELSETPFSHATLSTLRYVLSMGSGPLGTVASEAIRRTGELEQNHATVQANAKALKNRLMGQLDKWKTFMDLLQNATAFLTGELPKRWLQISGDPLHAARTAPTTSPSPTRPFQPIAYLNEKLQSLALNTADKPPVAMTESLRDCETQQSQTVAVLSHLVTFKRDIVNAAHDIGLTALDTNSNIGAGNSSSVEQLAKNVLVTVDRESSKLEIRANQLLELHTRWTRYTRARDAFRRWLTDQQKAAQHMLEVPSQESEMDDQDIQAIEEFLKNLRDKESKLKEVYSTHRELTGHKVDIHDSVLDQVKSEFELLLSRTEVRFRSAQKERELVKQRSAMSARRTQKRIRMLNQLAQSVRKINEEISVQKTEDYASEDIVHLISQIPPCPHCDN